MQKLTILFALFIGLSPNLGLTDTLRGKEFIVNCAEADKPANASSAKFFWQINCTAYLNGLMDAYSVMVQSPGNAKIFCPPDIGISLDENIRIVRRFIKNHPDMQDMPVRSLALAAYHEEFPCK